MKTLLLLLPLLFGPFFQGFAQPSLGDWANRHRQADNLFKQGQFEEAIKQYDMSSRKVPFQERNIVT